MDATELKRRVNIVKKANEQISDFVDNEEKVETRMSTSVCTNYNIPVDVGKEGEIRVDVDFFTQKAIRMNAGTCVVIGGNYRSVSVGSIADFEEVEELSGFLEGLLEELKEEVKKIVHNENSNQENK